MEVVQCDHTKVDIILVDSTNSEELGHLIITVGTNLYNSAQGPARKNFIQF